MVDINNFNEHFNQFFDPNVGFWSASRMAYKIKSHPEYRDYETSRIKEKIEKKEAWARHKEHRKPKHHNSIQVHNIGSFQMDLADFTSFNHPQYKWLLCIIDVFSRFLIAFPLRSKSNDELIPQIDHFIQQWNSGFYVKKALNINKPPSRPALKSEKKEIEIDEEDSDNEQENNNANPLPDEKHYLKEKYDNEFKDVVLAISGDSDFMINDEFIKLCKKYNIEMYPSPPNEHSGRTSIVDRVIRTVRGMLGRYFTHNNTNNWVGVIEQLVDNYNNTKHRMIGVPPRWALGHKDKNQKPNPKYIKSLKNKKDNIKVGDWVRIPYEGRNKFNTKQNLPYWSKKVYVVSKKVKNRFVVERKGVEVKGGNNKTKTFASQNLQKIYDKSSISQNERPIQQNIEEDDDNDISITLPVLSDNESDTESDNESDIHLNMQKNRKVNKKKAQMDYNLETNFNNPLPKEKVRKIPFINDRLDPAIERQKDILKSKQRKKLLPAKSKPLLPAKNQPLIIKPTPLRRHFSDWYSQPITDKHKPLNQRIPLLYDEEHRRHKPHNQLYTRWGMIGYKHGLRMMNREIQPPPLPQPLPPPAPIFPLKPYFPPNY